MAICFPTASSADEKVTHARLLFYSTMKHKPDRTNARDPVRALIRDDVYGDETAPSVVCDAFIELIHASDEDENVVEGWDATMHLLFRDLANEYAGLTYAATDGGDDGSSTATLDEETKEDSAVPVAGDPDRGRRGSDDHDVEMADAQSDGPPPSAGETQTPSTRRCVPAADGGGRMNTREPLGETFDSFLVKKIVNKRPHDKQGKDRWDAWQTVTSKLVARGCADGTTIRQLQGRFITILCRETTRPGCVLPGPLRAELMKYSQKAKYPNKAMRNFVASLRMPHEDAFPPVRVEASAAASSENEPGRVVDLTSASTARSTPANADFATMAQLVREQSELVKSLMAHLPVHNK